MHDPQWGANSIQAQPHTAVNLTLWRAGQYADQSMRASSRNLLLLAIGLSILVFIVYRSSDFLHLANFSGAGLLHSIRQANLYYLAPRRPTGSPRTCPAAAPPASPPFAQLLRDALR